MCNTLRHPAAELVPGLMGLLGKSMATSTWVTYDRALRSLQDFIMDFDLPYQWPMCPALVALYVSHLHECGYASSSISTYLSAISYVHKLAELPDPTTSWLVEKVVTGARRDRPQHDIRRPVTRSILEQLVKAADFCITNFYERFMFVGMLRLSFSAFLRVGEMSKSQGNLANVLCLENIKFKSLCGSPAVEINFTQYKHSAGRMARLTVADLATVTALQKYLSFRGNSPGFLFCWPLGNPVHSEHFTHWLQGVLRFCGLDTAHYKSHSLRIGAACQALADGYSEAQIREWGRWHSDAFKKYLRFF